MNESEPLPNQVEDVLRRSMDAYLRYYGAVGKLTMDYMKDLMATWSQVRLPSTLNVSPFTTAPAQPPTHQAAPRATEPVAHAAPQSIGVMVLESEAGGGAIGVFLVENHLGQAISARVAATGFFAPDGREIHPPLSFDPEAIELQPGEQLLVRVVAAIDESMEPDLRYQGEFTVPELTGTRIPVVLRRRLSAASAEPASRKSPEKAEKRRSASQTRAGRNRTLKTKRASGGKKG